MTSLPPNHILIWLFKIAKEKTCSPLELKHTQITFVDCQRPVSTLDVTQHVVKLQNCINWKLCILARNSHVHTYHPNTLSCACWEPCIFKVWSYNWFNIFCHLSPFIPGFPATFCSDISFSILPRNLISFPNCPFVPSSARMKCVWLGSSSTPFRFLVSMRYVAGNWPWIKIASRKWRLVFAELWHSSEAQFIFLTNATCKELGCAQLLRKQSWVMSSSRFEWNINRKYEPSFRRLQ